MKAMYSDWNAGSAKMLYSSAVKQEHEGMNRTETCPRSSNRSVQTNRWNIMDGDSAPFGHESIIESDILSSSTSSLY